jgi:hypothetical protein
METCFIEDQARVYEACARAILLDVEAAHDRTISIASLHGHSGRRTIEEVAANSGLRSSLESFNEAVANRIADQTNPWKVRQLVNIVSRERLDNFLSRVSDFTESSDYQVRAFSKTDSLATISPLIIANRSVFLANDDDRLYRANSALHVEHDDAVSWANRWFEEL